MQVQKRIVQRNYINTNKSIIGKLYTHLRWPWELGSTQVTPWWMGCCQAAGRTALQCSHLGPKAQRRCRVCGKKCGIYPAGGRETFSKASLLKQTSRAYVSISSPGDAFVFRCLTPRVSHCSSLLLWLVDSNFRIIHSVPIFRSSQH